MACVVGIDRLLIRVSDDGDVGLHHYAFQLRSRNAVNALGDFPHQPGARRKRNTR